MRDLTPQPGPGDPNHFPAINAWMEGLNLGPDAMAWDIGFWEAHCIRHLVRLYPCRIYGFEPQALFYQPAVEEFAALPNVQLFNFALGDRTGDFPMAQPGTSYCSFIGGESAEVRIEGRMVDIADFMAREDIRRVDFCMMNCEGYELILIPYLARNRLLGRFRNLMIQWHLRWGGAAPLFPKAQGTLRASHALHVDAGISWQAWTLKEAAPCQ